jgi:hypothetical protein
MTVIGKPVSTAPMAAYGRLPALVRTTHYDPERSVVTGRFREAIMNQGENHAAASPITRVADD